MRDYARMLSAKNHHAPRHFRGDMPPKRISFIFTNFKIIRYDFTHKKFRRPFTEFFLNKYIYMFLQLYEDRKTCVLTREFLEAEERELEEDYAIPVTIICLVGALGKNISLIQNFLSRYLISRKDTVIGNILTLQPDVAYVGIAPSLKIRK